MYSTLYTCLCYCTFLQLLIASIVLATQPFISEEEDSGLYNPVVVRNRPLLLGESWGTPRSSRFGLAGKRGGRVFDFGRVFGDNEKRGGRVFDFGRVFGEEKRGGRVFDFGRVFGENEKRGQTNGFIGSRGKKSTSAVSFFGSRGKKSENLLYPSNAKRELLAFLNAQNLHDVE